MVQIVFVDTQGARRAVEARAGASVMQTAIANAVAGIVGECGGNCVCATCHVYVEENAPFPPIGEDEDALLDGVAAERRPTSRLSCQLKLTDQMEGLVISLPSKQT